MSSGNPWIHESLWREAVDTLNDELADDLSNIGELCREIPLRIFGQILLNPAESLDRAGKLLPTMPGDDVQFQWTGNSGVTLLEESVDFIRTVVEAASLSRIDPRQCRVLDFGIGWGRLARLWLKYAGPDRLDGCDAWEESLEKSRQCGLRNRLVRSDPLLTELPFEEASFDIIWGFSVFTHLSPEAMLCGLSGLRNMLKQSGTLVFTVRPHTYWDLEQPRELMSNASTGQMVNTNDVRFLQHHSADPYYGDISVSGGFIRETCRAAGLALVSMSWTTRDPYQVSVIAQPI